MKWRKPPAIYLMSYKAAYSINGLKKKQSKTPNNVITYTDKCFSPQNFLFFAFLLPPLWKFFCLRKFLRKISKDHDVKMFLSVYWNRVKSIELNRLGSTRLLSFSCSRDQNFVKNRFWKNSKKRNCYDHPNPLFTLKWRKGIFGW